ncbi:MAG: NUDIX domain-containing protein [Chloroflexota bacterium]
MKGNTHMYPVRNSVKAIIIKNNKLLCIKKSDSDGNYFILPGGGQDKDETFLETIMRECKEELGSRIKVGKLKYIREYIGKNHEFSETDKAHQVEYMFECELTEEPNLEYATNLDEGQEGIEWVEITRSNNRVYPKVLIERLYEKYEEIYWGDIN